MFFWSLATAVAQPLALGGQVNARKKKESQSVIITLGLRVGLLALFRNIEMTK